MKGGWFYSVPSMILTGLLIAVAIPALLFIAKPALATDRGQDIRGCIARSWNLVMAGTGALLLHLGLIFNSLVATASLRAVFTTSAGPMTSWTTLSALAPTFRLASILRAGLGVTLWVILVLSAFPSRQRAPIAVLP